MSRAPRLPGQPWTMNEAAAELRISRRFLQDFLKTIPTVHLAAGRRKLFDEAGLAAIRDAMKAKAREKECRTSSSPRKPGARRTIAFVEPSMESELIEALRRVPNRKPRR